MAIEKTARFEELTKLATDFVTTQKGLWDHTDWNDFVSNVKAKGFDVSEEMQSSLGDLLEAIKRFYVVAGSTVSMEKAMKAVVNDSVTFVKQHKGAWGHSDWEEFVKTVRQNTLSVSEGATEYLGGVLESMKVFYALSPVAAVQKRVVAARAKPSPAARPAVVSGKKAETKPASIRAPIGANVVRTQKQKQKQEPPPASPSKKDDLTTIGGIGPALAKKLNGAGIHSYAQLAALTVAEIENLEQNIIRFSGRVKRDDWVGQAKKLSQAR